MADVLALAPRSKPGPAGSGLEPRLERMCLLALRALRRTEDGMAAGAALDGAIAAVERGLTPGRDDALARRLGLRPDEVDFMWLAVALSVDPRLGPIAVKLAGAEARRGATLALFAAITDLAPARLQALAMALRPGHLLVAHGLLEPADAETVAALTPYRAAPRLVSHLAGGAELDPVLAATQVPADFELDGAGEALRQRVAAALASSAPALVVITGRIGAGRRTLLARAAEDAGQAAVVLDLERLAPTLAALEPALVALRREHLLSRALPVIAGLGDLTPERDGVTRCRALERFIDSFDGPVAVVAAATDVELHPDRPVIALELRAPEPAARRALWRRALGADADVDELAMRYRISPGEMTRVVGAARFAARSRGATTPSPRELADGVRATIRQRLAGLAERIEVRHEWDDLVLPADVQAQITDLIGRVRNAYQVLESWRFRDLAARGGGIAALFAGAPGTGKTMAAGLVARALELDLYQVDLSAVVSKWIGETEKNLSRVFEAADAGHALLLFDEADALFAKRTEVRGANDRHANLEVNHLLTRIEAFGGFAILTTNLDASLDPALRRRLAAKVDFWPPDERERAALWRRMLDGRAPLAADVDMARLARKFSALTGGTIRNAALTAAFRAAATGSPIDQAGLERAAADEYQANGRIWNEEKKS
jgi:hypothetical protein